MQNATFETGLRNTSALSCKWIKPNVLRRVILMDDPTILSAYVYPDALVIRRDMFPSSFPLFGALMAQSSPQRWRNCMSEQWCNFQSGGAIFRAVTQSSRRGWQWKKSMESLMCNHPYFADTISREEFRRREIRPSERWRNRQRKRLSPLRSWVQFSSPTLDIRAKRIRQRSSTESRVFSPGTPVSSHRECWQGGLGLSPLLTLPS
jgi:hypothetical protein